MALRTDWLDYWSSLCYTELGEPPAPFWGRLFSLKQHMPLSQLDCTAAMHWTWATDFYWESKYGSISHTPSQHDSELKVVIISLLAQDHLSHMNLPP